MLSGAHFLPERGGGGWNPRHSFLQAVLLSAAQFAGQPLLYRLLSCTQFRGAGVGISRTVCGGRGCYRQHNFCAVRSAGQKIPVVIGRTIQTFFCGRQVVIHSTICAVWKIDYCYRQHNSDFGRLSKSVYTGLLSGAHFRQLGCYRAHSFQTVEFWRLLLSTAHFRKIHRTAHSRYCYSRHNSLFPGRNGCYPAHNSQKSCFLRCLLPWVVSLRTVCPAGAGVVIDGTIQGFFCAGCYSAHNSPRQDFSIRPVGMLRTFLTFPFFAPGVVILDTF